MIALILNSGMGTRMGDLTKDHPKCMTNLVSGETILSRQLKLISSIGIKKVVVTTGYYHDILTNYCNSLKLPIEITFVNNPLYRTTNYIYSIYCARDYLRYDDVLLMHGDIVFDDKILYQICERKDSCVAVSSTQPLPEKDFKAVINQEKVIKIGIDYFGNAISAQPLYKLNQADWSLWLNQMIRFVESGQVKCYAENAFNEVSEYCNFGMFDCKDLLCNEVDTPEDLAKINVRLKSGKTTVYMCFSTDIVHSGHIEIIKKASKLGELTIGVLSDEAVASYKRYPILPFEERKTLFENVKGVFKVVRQEELSYKQIINDMYPSIVVHGDNWKEGFQKPIRDEVIELLNRYGGKLVEFPYSNNEKFKELERQSRAQLAMPDYRRSRLKKLIAMKGCINAIEAHSGITGLIAEQTKVLQDGKTYQFDAMWVSSLCDSTAKGKPDIELVDMTSRFRTIDDIMEVTTKPIIFDGDTGGLTEHFVYTVKSLERMGVSMVIIEDKTGLKKNSLFGTEVEQTQDSIENFCYKIQAGKKSKKTKDFMIVARIESLILERGMEDALSRAFAYVKAGADGIMIHSRKKEPAEIFEFVNKFREKDSVTPIVVVPTSFNSVTEQDFKERGVNVVIYANHLTRSGFPAMQKTAQTILENHRALEADKMCMSIKDIITLIPEE